MNDTDLRLYQSQFDSLYKECQDLYRSSARLLNLSECAMWVLYVLSEQDASYTQSSIGERLSQPRQTINSTIRALEKQQIIILVPAPESKKEKLIQLTDKGKDYVSQNILPFVYAEQETFRHMGADDCPELFRLMKKYNDLYRIELDKISASIGKRNKKAEHSEV